MTKKDNFYVKVTDVHYVDYVLQALIWNNISRHCTNPHLHI